MSGPLGSLLTSEDFRKIAAPTLVKLMENGTKIVAMLKSDLKVEGQEVTFLCPENVQRWSVAFTCKKNILGGGSKAFQFPIRQVDLKSVVPLRDVTKDAIIMLPDGGFELSYSHLQDGIPYILRIMFDIESAKFVDSIVNRTTQREVVQEDKKEYWMHAQLKFVDVLERYYSQVKLEDLDFNVDVAVHEDVKTSIPHEFEKELEVVVKWMGETDRERKAGLSREHLRMMRGRKVVKREHLLKFLGDLQDIFLPSAFRRFVEVKQDFHYHDCMRGLDYYTMPFPSWPKFMKVVSRASLDIDKPAALGILEFKHSDFRSKIDQILSRK